MLASQGLLSVCRDETCNRKLRSTVLKEICFSAEKIVHLIKLLASGRGLKNPEFFAYVPNGQPLT